MRRCFRGRLRESLRLIHLNWSVAGPADGGGRCRRSRGGRPDAG
jgi:hypothetical protein